MKKFIEYIRDMMSGGDKASSKRFWGSLIMLSAIILSYILLLDNCDDIPTNKLYLLTSMYFFGSICLGLGIFDKIKGKKNV